MSSFSLALMVEVIHDDHPFSLRNSASSLPITLGEHSKRTWCLHLRFLLFHKLQILHHPSIQHKGCPCIRSLGGTIPQIWGANKRQSQNGPKVSWSMGTNRHSKIWQWLSPKPRTPEGSVGLGELEGSTELRWSLRNLAIFSNWLLPKNYYKLAYMRGNLWELWFWL